MPKIALFLLKNRKNRRALGAPPPDSSCLKRLRALPPDPRLRRLEASPPVPHWPLDPRTSAPWWIPGCAPVLINIEKYYLVILSCNSKNVIPKIPKVKTFSNLFWVLLVLSSMQNSY